MAQSRSVHVVRIFDPNNKKIWIDVKIIDKVSFKSPSNPAQEHSGTKEITPFTGGPNVFEQMIDLTNPVPYIKDNSGDNNGTGDPNNCTRVSHMVRVTNPDDASQFLDIEICDGVAFATTEGQQEVLLFPASNATARVVDGTPDSAGLENDPGIDATRLEHIVEIAATKDGTSTSTDLATDPQGLDTENMETPPMVTLVQRTDAMAFKAPNGLEFVIAFDPKTKEEDNEIDTTRYLPDPVTGDLTVPPENTDPNPYIIFPPDPKTKDKSGGPWLGTKLSVKPGPLWWPIRINTPPGPFYWYIPKFQPLDWSYFATAPEDYGSWPSPGISGAGFMLIPYYPMIWILSPNSEPASLPAIGFASLEDAILNGSAGLETMGPELPNGSPPSGDWGQFDLLQPPISAQEIADNDTVPNIYQLTGIKQPVDLNGTPVLPNSEQREKIVTAFADMWNSVADATNAEIAGWVGPDFNSDARPTGPPVWPFVIPSPWHTNFEANHFSAFVGPITVGLFSGGIPLEVLEQGNCTPIAIDQLDNSKWNTNVFPPTLK
jgi:hypothetical protein